MSYSRYFSQDWLQNGGFAIFQVEEFDPWLFVPSYLYVSRWKSAQDRLFPSQGERVYIFLAGNDRLNWDKLDNLVTHLENQTDILTQVDSWHSHFKDYWEYNFKTHEGKLAIYYWLN